MRTNYLLSVVYAGRGTRCTMNVRFKKGPLSMTPPIKSFDLLVDEIIETEIDRWVEEKQREAEQLDLIETGDEEAITSADYNDL